MSFSFDSLIHLANIIYLFAFLVRDIFWLRILTVLASVFLVTYFYFLPEPLITAIYWNLAFTALNLYWITRLYLERRPVKLSEREEKLCELVFGTMTPREMITLLKLASWHEADVGECFLDQGAPLDRLMVIYSGKSCVWLDDRFVTELQPGQFIGGISYVTDEPSVVSVVASAPTCYVSWPKSKLKKFMQHHPELHSALKSSLAIDLTRWLKGSWEMSDV